jgi:PIN like domain
MPVESVAWIKLLRTWNHKMRFVIGGTVRDYSTDMVALCKIAGVTTGNLDVATQAPFGGLFKGFEGYRTPSDEDYRTALTNALVVLDTNVLLNLYRYNDETRSSMIDVMKERYSKPHVIEKKNSPRAASNASS